MKIVSWNVNGIRANLSKGFNNSIASLNPDIICLQETKAHPDQVALDLPGYRIYWNSAEKSGYAGTAILVRFAPRAFHLGIGNAMHDAEGRVITLEYDDFFLVNAYVPNSQRGLFRLNYRMVWDEAFTGFLNDLDKSKPVLFCGDLNVAHQEIDIARPYDNLRNPGFTDEERTNFSTLLSRGFADTYRSLYPRRIGYSWWSLMNNCRSRNIGWRIDYVCCSEKLLSRVSDAMIFPEITGSDHCPVGIEIAL